MIQNNLSNLTLLCPVKDRFEYLERFLKYLIISKCNFNIYIADGSNNELDYSIISNAQKYLKLVYKKYDYDETWTNFLNKMCLSLNDIKTPYTCLVCDDDFYDISEMNKAIDLLDNNNNLATYCGEVVDFNIISDDIMKIYGEISIKNDNRLCSGRYKSNMNVISEDINSRLDNYLNIWPYENITKTKVLVDIFEIAKISEINNYHHLIQIFRILILLNGSVYYSSKPFTLRQSNTYTSDGLDLVNNYPTQLHFLSKLSNLEKEDIIIQNIFNYIDSYKLEEKLNLYHSILFCFIKNYRNSIQRDFLFHKSERNNTFINFYRKISNKFISYFNSIEDNCYENINLDFLLNIKLTIKSIK